MEIGQQVDLMEIRKQVEKKISTCPLIFRSPFFLSNMNLCFRFSFFPPHNKQRKKTKFGRTHGIEPTNNENHIHINFDLKI